MVERTENIIDESITSMVPIWPMESKEVLSNNDTENEAFATPLKKVRALAIVATVLERENFFSVSTCCALR